MPEDKGKIAAQMRQQSGWDLKAWTKSMLDYQKSAIENNMTKTNSDRDEWLKQVFGSSLTAKAHWVAEDCNTEFRKWLVARWIRDYFAKPENWGYDYSNVDDTPLIDGYIEANEDRRNGIYDFILDTSEYCDPTQLYIDMWWDEPEEVSTEWESSSMASNIAQSVLDVPLNLGKLPFNLIDKWTAWVAKQFSDDDEAVDQQLQENLQKSEDALTLPWVNREDLSYQIPNVVTDLWVTVATSFIPWVWEAKWAEWAAKYPKLAKLIKSVWSVEKLAEKYPKLAPYLKGWELWVKDTVTMNALEWEWTTPLEALEWWLAWWIVERWLKGLKWLSTFLETNWLFTKSKANQIIKKLKDIDSAPWKWTVDDLADFMTKHGLTWSKKNIISKAEQLGGEKKKILDELLAQSDSIHSMEEADEALELLIKKLEEWAADAPMIPREEEIVELNKLIGKSWKYTLSDLEKIKMKIDEHLKLYNKNWNPADNQSAKWWRETRKKIQRYIEDVAKEEDLWNVAMLNNEIQTSYAIADWIANRNALDTINNYLWEYWIYWVFWIPVIKDIKNWDYEWALRDGAMAFLFWNSWFKTHLWSMLNRMSGTNRYEVDQWIASEWKNKLSESASKEVADILNRDTSVKEWIKQYITNFVKESGIIGGQKWTEAIVDELKN